MKVYHYHPDGIIYIRTNAVLYIATEAEFLLDYGQAAIKPSGAYNEIYYDIEDTNQRENRHNVNLLNDLIDTVDLNIEAIINDLPNLLIAEAARNFVPPPTFNEIKNEKISELGRETVARCNGIIGDGITSFGHLRLIRAQFLSVIPSARSATPELQSMIEVFQAGEVAAEFVTNLTTEAEIVAYNVATDPSWP